ncbi:HEAT repeat domain-containing protein [Lysobacter sp. BMK333-48F3]|uniref:HEAT repeat domain-containing protein n=1 Tax=Lysobacter sp. BMK333-48F3 TaxID=2867962 RepID=UPI001C8BA7FC|nr:HEAT repeat domain-containing protein [Lysobacter sp. BMK333-48F3]MBX9401687.1 HEAT repeat domain-containing protein [Lysobacter sp. BMK333-48F3]
MGPFKDGWTKQDIEAAITRGLPDELAYVPILIGMDPPDCAWAEAICVTLARHPDADVRANAVLGLGHLARTCGRLDLSVAVPTIAAALQDADPHVRGQADAAADDLSQYLGVAVPQPIP